MHRRAFYAYLVLAGLFLAALVVCNLIVLKFFGFHWPEFLPGVGGDIAVLSAGILPYPLTFLVTDLLSEIYGKRRANAVVWVGFLVSIFIVVVIQIAMAVPSLRSPGYAGPWMPPPNEERPVVWTGPIELEVREPGRSPDRILLRSEAREFQSPAQVVAALEAARLAAGGEALALRFAWESEWLGDLSGPSGRGRLRLSSALPSARDHEDGYSSLAVQAMGSLSEYLPQGPLMSLQDAPVPDALFHHVFGNTWRAILASMIAYLIAQWFDIQAFHFWKRLTRGKHLWLRNNFSTILSQFIDTTLVVTVLFIGVWPSSLIWQAILSGWIFKALVALSDTPFFYLGVWIFRRFGLAPRGSEYAPKEGSPLLDAEA